MRVLVVANMWPSPEAPYRGIFVSEQVAALRARGIQVEVLHLSPSLGKARYLTAPLRVAATVWRKSIDIVHAHYGLTGAFSRAPQVPLVVTYHGSDVMLSSQRRFSKIAARLADANICVSESVRRTLDTPDAIVIPCGVDTSQFRPLDRAEARTRLGIKGDHAIALFGAAPANPLKAYDLFKAAVDHAGIAHRALVDIKREDVPWLMAAVDVLVMTSTHEGSPMVVKEALACGLPVVSVDVGDVSHRLAGIKQCHIVERNAELVARAIKEVVDSPQRITPQPSIEDFSADGIAEQLETIYTSLLRR